MALALELWRRVNTTSRATSAYLSRGGPRLPGALAAPPRRNSLSARLPSLRPQSRQPRCCFWRFCGWKTEWSTPSAWAGTRSITSCPKRDRSCFAS